MYGTLENSSTVDMMFPKDYKRQNDRDNFMSKLVFHEILIKPGESISFQDNYFFRATILGNLTLHGISEGGTAELKFEYSNYPEKLGWLMLDTPIEFPQDLPYFHAFSLVYVSNYIRYTVTNTSSNNIKFTLSPAFA